MDVRSSADPGDRVIGYTCSYVPPEVLTAAGLSPRQPVPKPRPAASEAYMHANTCAYLKSLLAAGLDGDGRSMEGIAFANACDGTRRLHDLWDAYVDAPPAFFLEVPKKKDPASVAYFASELWRFAGALDARLPGRRVTEDRLREAIAVHNDLRWRMETVFARQRDPDSPLTGLPVFRLCMEGLRSDPERFSAEVDRFLSDSEGEAPPGDGPRVVLTGNILHDADRVALIEALGGRVIALDTCNGIRHYNRAVDPDAPDPMTAIAERTLKKAPCPRMEGLEERARFLEDLVRDASADGVIHSTLKFCDACIDDLPYLRDRLTEQGIPFLDLENNYEEDGAGQAATRVEAFFEMIRSRS